MPLSRRRRLLVIALALLCTPILLFAIGGLWFNARYVQRQTMQRDAVEREFATVRGRLQAQEPFLEYRQFSAPVVRRNPSAPRRELRALHVLAYDPEEEQLTRAEIPQYLLRIITLGGRRRLISEGFFGTIQERITLEDLERHGPGVVLDASGADVGAMVAANAAFGVGALGTRILIWAE